MKKYKTLFITSRSKRHQEEALAAVPDELDLVLLESPDFQEIVKHLKNADYIISERIGILDDRFFSYSPNVKLIQRLGILYYDIDLKAASRTGVVVCYRPIRSTINVAEHMIFQMLSLAKRWNDLVKVMYNLESCSTISTNANEFCYNWSNRNNLRSLCGATVGIFGFGQIGAELTNRLTGWNCKIIYHKRNRLSVNAEKALNIHYKAPLEILKTSDFICNLLPLNDNSYHWFNKTTISQMKANAFFVSCSSGATMDDYFLAEALTKKLLSGVALDSFSVEPLQPNNPLVLAQKAGFNVLLTPHVAAGNTMDPIEKRKDDYTSILKHIRNEDIHYRLN